MKYFKIVFILLALRLTDQSWMKNYVSAMSISSVFSKWRVGMDLIGLWKKNFYNKFLSCLRSDGTVTERLMWKLPSNFKTYLRVQGIINNYKDMHFLKSSPNDGSPWIPVVVLWGICLITVSCKFENVSRF
jgi:hypothetical protein